MISIGIGGTWPAALAGELALEAESRGFGRLWINDVPGGDALEKLAAAAAATSRLRLGAGVISVTARPAAEIAARVAELGLPVSRLDLGLGSGQGSHPVERVGEALDGLAGLGAALWVGALGPRMRELAARRADGVLLNWLTAGPAREQAELAARQAAEAGRPAPAVALYVRTAVDPAAASALEHEAAKYSRIPPYAANFARLGITAEEAAIRPVDDVRARLVELETGVGEVVVRLILPGDPDLADALRILDTVKP